MTSIELIEDIRADISIFLNESYLTINSATSKELLKHLDNAFSEYFDDRIDEMTDI